MITMSLTAAYWFNLPEPQVIRSFRDSSRLASSVHLHLERLTPPCTVSVQAIVGDTAMFTREFKLYSFTGEQSGFALRVREGRVHLWAETPALPALPERLAVLLVDDSGEREFSVHCRYHRLFGQVTDFTGKPFKGFVRVNPDGFGDDGVGTWTDADGHYSLVLPERTYNSIWVDDESYGIQTLEAWAWHIIMDEDQRMDFQIGTGEVYGLHAWPCNGGSNNYYLAFRPMVLMLPVHPEGNDQPMQQIATHEEKLHGQQLQVYDLSPELLPEDLSVTVNGATAKVLSVQRFLETDENCTGMVNYLVQVSRRGLPRSGKQTVMLKYAKDIQPGNARYCGCSMGYYQFYLNAQGFER